MASCPRQNAAPLAVTPMQGGLFSVAQFPPAPDHFECGLQWQPEPVCGWPIGFTSDECTNNVVVRGADKTTVDGWPVTQADAFTIFAGFTCRSQGHSLEEIEQRARRAISLNEERAVEEAFWKGSGTFGQRSLQGATVLNEMAGTPAAAVALNSYAALSLLEDWLGRNYAGQGTIHAPRGMAALWKEALCGCGTYPVRTALGTAIAFGGGYSRASRFGPDGTEVTGNRAWVYATGAVGIWRSDVFFSTEPLTQALNRETNEVNLVAERTYVVGRDCDAAAVLVDLSIC